MTVSADRRPARAALLLAAACGDDDAGRAATTHHSGATDRDDGRWRCPTGTLVIYSGRGEDLVGPIVEQFTEVTGIETEVRYGNSAEMLLLIQEEGANSPADVYYSQGAGFLGTLSERRSGRAARRRPRPGGRPRAAFADGDWVGSPAGPAPSSTTPTCSPRTTCPTASSTSPTPEWSGRIGWAPTNASFQDHVTALRFLLGEDAARDWLEGIMANNPVPYENNGAILQGVAAGEVDVGFVNHYYLYRNLAEDPDFPVANKYYTDGDPGALVNIAGAGVLATSDQQDAGPRVPSVPALARGPAVLRRRELRAPGRRRRRPPEGPPNRLPRPARVRPQPAARPAGHRRPAHRGGRALIPAPRDGEAAVTTTLDGSGPGPRGRGRSRRRAPAALVVVRVAAAAPPRLCSSALGAAVPLTYLVWRTHELGWSEAWEIASSDRSRRLLWSTLRLAVAVTAASVVISVPVRLAHHPHRPADAPVLDRRHRHAAGGAHLRRLVGDDRRAGPRACSRAGSSRRGVDRSRRSTGSGAPSSCSRCSPTPTCCSPCGPRTGASTRASRRPAACWAAARSPRSCGWCCPSCARRSWRARCWCRSTRCRTSAPCRCCATTPSPERSSSSTAARSTGARQPCSG
jgi:iron(III) transport system substrate-binding protein